MTLHNTDVRTKRKNWEKFVRLLENQFNFGGDKYALEGQEDKEVTDWVCELVPGKTGVDWVLGNMVKYIGRYKNLEREKDLLKIATYCYICWLKKGYHLKDEHDEDIKK